MSVSCAAPPANVVLRLLPALVAWLLAGPTRTTAAALPEWQFRQPVDVSAAGLSRVLLSPETFDAARPDLADLRLIDPAGEEVPYVLEFPPPAPPTVYPVRDSAIVVEPAQTRIEFGLTNLARLIGVSLETPAGQFLKAVTIEGAPARGAFRPLSVGQPVFRQGSASRLFLELKGATPAWNRLRLTVDDSRSAPIAITGVFLHEQAAPPPVPLRAPARIVDRLDGPGETRWTVDLGYAHLPIVGLRLASTEPLFTRHVTILTRAWVNEEVRERMLGAGTVFRVALEGQPAAEQLEFPARFQAERELLVVVENGDSPPVALTGIEFLREPVSIVFLARRSGVHQLYSGNPRASPPRYDVARLVGSLRESTALTAGSIQGNSDYHPAEALPEVSVWGAAMDPSGWKFRRAIQVTGTGVQRLELPAHVLAHAQPGFTDLRLFASGRQVVYLLDQTAFTRAVAVEAKSDPIPDQPRLSRWRLQLPQPALPITRLRCQATLPLFQRDLQLWEQRQTSAGEEYRHVLGRATWLRTSARPVSFFEIAVQGVPSGDTIFLGTDNGDNAVLELDRFQAFIPVVRLLFQSPPGIPVELCYGNPQAPPAHYDLSLIAAQVLAASKSEATLPGLDPVPTGPKAHAITLPASALFYGVLTLVVLGLLVVITRLLPKPGSGDKPGGESGETRNKGDAET